MNILITGGAGYIGSVLVRRMIQKGYNVRVLDKLSFGGEPIVDLLNDNKFEFQLGDVTNASDVKNAVSGMDAVVHLASIVGDPACAKEPELARNTNIDGSFLLYQEAYKAGVTRFVFASTCSNYGKMDDPESFVTEDSTLSPVSLYAETKVEVENFLLNQRRDTNISPTCLRFSTVYGLSPRVRFDLTVNEFTRELSLGRELVIFGEQFWRPYCHVVDLARSAIAVIETSKDDVNFEVFNVGDTSENYTKKMIVEEISKQIPNTKISYVQKDEDPRDYRVSFQKIKERIGFEITKKVPDGISQIIYSLKSGFFKNPDDRKFSNI